MHQLKAKPILKIKYNKSAVKDMYPRSLTFTMKIIAARSKGKTIFLIAFLYSLLNRVIVKHEDIYIFCLTFDNQDQWRSSGFNARNFSLAYITWCIFFSFNPFLKQDFNM